MAWVQDDLKTVEVSVEKEEGEGKVEVFDLWIDYPGVAKPGTEYRVGGAIRNNGGTDNCKLVIAFLENLGGGTSDYLVYQEKIEKVWAGKEMYFETRLTLPASYDKDTVYLVGIGYHEE